jgi:hypothetical protein
MRKTMLALGCILTTAGLASATPVTLYSNLVVTSGMAAASGSDALGGLEIEAADDFVLNGAAAITEFKFIGLVTSGGTVDQSLTNLEIYQVFPKDSLNPPSGHVPTRVNSPSDVAFAEVGAPGVASFTMTTLAPSFTAANSVQNGIHPLPNVTTGGEGAVTGTEVLFDVVLTSPVVLSPDHYFFVPQILVNGGDFYWLSASRPIAGAGTTPFAPDLQAWIRNSQLDPDWLRIGTDIVGGNPAPTFNMAFEIDGDAIATPEPASLLLIGTGLGVLVRRFRRALPARPATSML